MNTLEELILEDNEIGDEGAGAIGNALLKDLTRLKTRDLNPFLYQFDHPYSFVNKNKSRQVETQFNAKFYQRYRWRAHLRRP